MTVYITTLASMVLLLSLLPSSLGDCQCQNPLQFTLQSYLGDPSITCRKRGVCFVPCDSSCKDVHPSKGFAARPDRCESGVACSMTGGTTTLAPIIVDLAGNGIEQDCVGSLCKQVNKINIQVENIQNCGHSNCVQIAGRK